MDKNKQPGITFEQIILVKEKFERDYDVPKDSELNLGIKIKIGDNDGIYSVRLNTSAKLEHDSKEVLVLESSFVGVFSVDAKAENMSMDDYVEKHAPGLMFPYIREHISSITQKAGNPILLPPVNLVTLINKKKEENAIFKEENK